MMNVVQPSVSAAGPEPGLGFRADINGLRAIAVLAVLGFHFAVPHFTGGFVGVDIFFVISGYLMTGIVLGRAERGTFTLAGFYFDRARRIVPALAVLIAAVLLLGMAILLPDEYRRLAKHAAASAAFVSNFVYWREGGYFDVDSTQKWLLHTWSLSVEWQFYLLYPPLLLGIVRIAPRRCWPILAAVATLSLAMALYCAATAPPSGFYLLPPRAWELLAGGLVYLAPPLPPRLTRAAQLAGFALVAGAALLPDARVWPAAMILLPVLGTALVLLARRTDSRITGNPVAAWIGLASYSIYLWHWPVALLLWRFELIQEPRWIAAGIAASLALGYLSWRFVERPGRRAGMPRIHTAPLPHGLGAHLPYAAALTLLIAASSGIWLANGFPQRVPPAVLAIAQEARRAGYPAAQGCYSFLRGVPERCVLGGRDGPLLLTVIGDSHADAALLGLIEALPPGVRGGIAFNAYADCPPILGALPTDPQNLCAGFNARFIEPQAGPRTTPLVLISDWIGYTHLPRITFDDAGGRDNAEVYRAHLLASTCTLAAAGPTYVMLPTPWFRYRIAPTLQRRLVVDPDAPDLAMPLAEFRAEASAILALFREAERRCGVRLLDPVPYLCPAEHCLASRGYHAIYRDRHHLTDYGSRLLTPMFRPLFATTATASLQ